MITRRRPSLPDAARPQRASKPAADLTALNGEGSARAEGLHLAHCDHPAGTAARLLLHRVGAPAPETSESSADASAATACPGTARPCTMGVPAGTTRWLPVPSQPRQGGIGGTHRWRGGVAPTWLI
jgi:hypothetical protein